MVAALVDYAKSHSFEPQPDNVEEFKDFPGEEIYGKIDGKDVYIGNQKSQYEQAVYKVKMSPIPPFSLSDSCRIGVKEAIEELKSMGIKIAMLTGDCQAAANHAQTQLGGALDVVHPELILF
ncbi:putative inactive cadmium/zinc-transporting ATPase HMA3 [Tanacetum coccineum]